MTNLTFDSNDLQTDNILTASIEHESIPSKDARLYPFAHANRSALPFVNYPTKTIRIRGKIIGSTIADLDSRLDTFRSYFNNKEANLDIDYNGGTRRYIATAIDVNVDRPGGLKFAEFDIVFACSLPFGQNTSATTAWNDAGVTTATDSQAHSFLGSAPYQLPIVTITINSVTDGANFISFTNDANDQGITIVGQTFVADDEIVIDCLERTVKLNGEEIDYSGSFPEFPPGSQTMNYADGFTARNVDIEVTYNALFL